MPIFASGLTMLEPTKGPMGPGSRSQETLVDTTKPDDSQVYTQVSNVEQNVLLMSGCRTDRDLLGVLSNLSKSTLFPIFFASFGQHCMALTLLKF